MSCVNPIKCWFFFPPKKYLLVVFVLKLHGRSSFRIVAQTAGRCFTICRSRRIGVVIAAAAATATRRQITGRLFDILSFVVLLKARHNAKIRLAFGTMVFGFASQYSAMSIDCVPTIVAAQRRTGPNDGAML